MSIRERLWRIGIGLLMVVVGAVAGFALIQQAIPTWGATPTEVARVVPGDELVPNAAVNWTHGLTINAPPETVWQWIAQMGERRGAFYSYTFIENQVGNGDVYHNADRIVPQWQNPKPGDVLIGGALPMQTLQVEPGKRLVGYMNGDMKWVWGWYLEPVGQNQTRLLVRMKIQTPPAMENPAVSTMIGLGGFVMEQGMLQGIQARAEGNVPPAYSEALEIALWVLALAAGMIGGFLFVTVKEWVLPLAVGLLALAALFVFTFIQPPLWIRLVADVILFVLLAREITARYLNPAAPTYPRDRSGTLRLKPLS